MLTITFLYNDENDKLLLFKAGQTRAEDENDADAVSTPGDEVFDTVVSAIPAFRDAEPGSIESITRTVDEFLDEYNLDIEMLEDKAGEDLDGDSETGEDEVHAETITTSPEPIYTDPFESLDKDTDTGYTDPDSALFT